MPTARRTPAPLLKATDIAALREVRRVHRINPRAIRNAKSLGDAVGMTNMGIHLARISPGDETTEYHTHQREEEFIFILSGKGIAEIGKRRYKVAAGDFMGFRAGSVPHCMSNPYAADLVYLLGGTREQFDVSDYPRAGVRAYRYAGERDTVRLKNIRKG